MTMQGRVPLTFSDLPERVQLVARWTADTFIKNSSWPAQSEVTRLCYKLQIEGRELRDLHNHDVFDGTLIFPPRGDVKVRVRPWVLRDLGLLTETFDRALEVFRQAVQTVSEGPEDLVLVHAVDVSRDRTVLRDLIGTIITDRVGGSPPSDDNRGEWSAPITLAELERVPATADDLLRRPDRHLPPVTATVVASQANVPVERDLQRFQIGDKLGAGGFADVWKAEDLTLRRTVALKFVRRSAPSAVDAAAHARVLAKVNHPNVVTVHDIVELRHPITADSADAIVMELLEGQTLEKRLREKYFSSQELLKAGHSLLNAIGAYHLRNMAHMDLHEENVILASPELKVLDPLFYERSRFGRTDVLQSKQKRDVRDVRDILARMLRHSEVSLESVVGFERATGQPQPTLDVLRAGLVSAIEGLQASDVALRPDLRPSRSAEPRLDVALDYEKATDSDGKRHQYQLKALLKNTGDVVIPGVDFRIKFPKRFLLPHWGYQGERPHSETETHRSFEDKEYGINIAPGEEYPRHLIVYQVTTELFIRDKGDMDLPVTVDAYVNGRRVGSVTKLFRDLQNF